jgi:hypothetical protein
MPQRVSAYSIPLRNLRPLVLMAILVGCSFPSEISWAAETPSFPADQIEFFEKKIRPVLVENCLECHGAGQQKAGLRLDTRGGVLAGGESGTSAVAHKPGDSLLIEAIRYEADGYQMPPKGKLSEVAIADLTKWVELGMPWPAGDVPAEGGKTEAAFDFKARAKHWSFQPIVRSETPAVKDATWAKTPIDPFILSKLEAAELPHASEAAPLARLRRLAIDVTGLPPTATEIAEFQADVRPDAWKHWVDRYLNSPQYGERFARHWMDLTRYAETHGHEFDYEIPQTWPYRDYLIRSFNSDVPYDQFLTEHVAGDLLAAPRLDSATGLNESVAGTAFWWLSQGKHSPVDIRSEECDTVDNQIDVFSKTFLGMTVACARCHDHKFDPIRIRDYYALAGYLQSSRRDVANRVAPSAYQPIIEGAQRDHDGRQPAINEAMLYAAGGFDWTPTEWLDAMATTHQKRITANPTDWLAAWMHLGALDDRDDFRTKKEQVASILLAQQHQAEAARKSAILLTDFGPGTSDGWLRSGMAFSFTDKSGLVDDGRPGEGEVSMREAGTAHSGTISQKLVGALRSRTFELKHRYLDIRVARLGGPPQPGKQIKNGQVHVIMDGFQLIKDPLYGSFTLNVPNDGVWRWFRLDLNRAVGANIYLEVVDDFADGWIAVDEVRLSDGPRAVDDLSLPILTWLADPEVLEPRHLAEKYLAWFKRGVAAQAQPEFPTDAYGQATRDIWQTAVKHEHLFPRDNDWKSKQQNVELQQTRWREALQKLPEPQFVVAMADGTAEDDRVLLRGNHKKPGPVEARRPLEVLGGLAVKAPTQGSGRMDLARNLTDPQNPLVARVIVNRLWHYHFGRGLVPTPDDFGKMGQPPSHPELLDWLASELVASGWSLKHIHRLILNSATWQQSSELAAAEFEALDPQNILLHRQNPRRLEAEAVRDSILAYSGRINLTMYGPPVATHLTPFMEGRGRPGRSGPLDGDGRRSIYLSVHRNFLNPFFLAFDFPTPFTSMGRRSTSNVPAQALVLLNNPFVLEEAKRCAERTAALEPSARIEALWLNAFCRPPTTEEQRQAQEFIAAQAGEYPAEDKLSAWRDLAHVLINSKEFFFVP